VSTTTTGTGTTTVTVPPPGPACFDLPADAGTDAGGCPTDPATILFALRVGACMTTDPSASEAKDIVSGPTTNAAGQCCYVIDYALCAIGGRPYLVGPAARVAPALRGGSDWSPAAALPPCLDGLDDGDRAALARAWTADALAEHASVASFSRFSLALLAAGAP